MSSTALFDVIDAFLTVAREALDTEDLGRVLVLDGMEPTDDPGDYLMIGTDNPDADDPTTAGETGQEWAHANYTSRLEKGTVTCVALSWNGNGDQAQARQGVRDIVAAFEEALRADPEIMPALHEKYSPFWTSFGLSGDYAQAQGTEGAMAQLTFTVGYQAYLP